MTLEEANKHLHDDWYIENGRLCVDEDKKDAFLEAVGMGIKALRPVSREQVEKGFPGCPKCRYEDDKEPMGIYYPDGWDNGIGFEYGKAIFCPECGRPLTDEAVEMVMERLEALHSETKTD